MKGKTVSLAFKGDVLTLLWNDWLGKSGVKPGEVDQVYNAQATNRYATLVSNAAQGALLNAPYDLRAEAEGYHELVDFGPLSDGYAMSAIAVRPDWLKTHGDVARGFLAAQEEGIAWLYDPANQAEAIAILARDTEQDAKIAAATYDDYVKRRKPFGRDLDLPQRFLTRTLAGAIEIGDAKEGTTLPAGLLDLSYRPK
jgi:ABC-type nitrate/sulfonate/bicarbonate transport system substrate-binding protein